MAKPLASVSVAVAFGSRKHISFGWQHRTVPVGPTPNYKLWAFFGRSVGAGSPKIVRLSLDVSKPAPTNFW
ncbi:MAG: hypothetical protein MUC60_10680, partial [Oscillatoria sp. Prado101]|nr:hypothetical protein [Oscillatoria sp. Prado101]